MIHIGNQTACWAASPTEPFDYALANGFDAFEWFPDKKPGAGWDESDLSASLRHSISKHARESNIRLSVHARWLANPLKPDSAAALLKDFELAQELGAALLNIHFYHEAGVQPYIQAITGLLQLTAKTHVQLAIENTPEHSPEEFNELFARLAETKEAPTSHVGMCLDLGHANLSAATRNDYLRFLDRLAPGLPIIHLHLHENWGDADTHLALFTGPAGRDDRGIRGLLERVQKRGFSGSIILEQWPHPPSLLNNARDRLLTLLGQTGGRGSRSTVAAAERQAEQAPSSPNSSPPAGEKTQAKPSKNGGKPDHAAARPSNELVPRVSGSTPKREHESLLQALSDSSRVDVPEVTDGFAAALIAADKRSRSWREKLDSLRVLLSKEKAPFGTAQLVDTAIYLRFLGAGQIKCSEDGRHFRPGHHAHIALDIYKSLTSSASGPETTWLIRKILPWLPSTAEPFRRAEPLTRIRDIAHRNDIPSELKHELKHSLQNKLHRCAGPEDLVTSAEFLKRFTAPGANYPSAFVEEFKRFDDELKEFFNASSLEERLKALLPKAGPEQAELISTFLDKKPATVFPDQLSALGVLTELRQQLVHSAANSPAESQGLLLADIGLEEFAFALLSTLLNPLEADFTNETKSDWTPALQLFSLTIRNLALSSVAPEESGAVLSEVEAWSNQFNCTERDQLLRLKATAERSRRLADTFSERILRLFPQSAKALGLALGVPEHAVRVFGEAEIRSHLVFQLSKLVSLLLRRIRLQLGLPPWDVLVSGHAAGQLKIVESLHELHQHHSAEPLITLVNQAHGDEEIPKPVAGIMLRHQLPHLSHLAVRARQAKVVFVASEEAGAFAKVCGLNGQNVELDATGHNVECKLTAKPTATNEPAAAAPVCIPAIELKPPHRWLSLDQAAADTAGGKAAGLRRLFELAEQSDTSFRVPDALIIPFGVMEASLAAAADLQQQFQELQRGFDAKSLDDATAATLALRDVLGNLSVPEEIISAVNKKFGRDARLIVRSSANCEDLEQLAGAGLYDSVLNVGPKDVASAVRTVWASLWSRRAAFSRKQNAIPHAQAHMAVLIQQMLAADYSFILHTVNPNRCDSSELYAELAVGLGETLASATERGTPYRLLCDKRSGEVTTVAFANFSQALSLAPSGLQRRIVNYAEMGLSNDAQFRQVLGRRLARVGRLVETAFGRPQDVEGVVVGKEIYLVQSRPQQGLPSSCTAPHP